MMDDVNSFVAGVKKVQLDSDGKFSPPSSDQVERLLAGVGIKCEINYSIQCKYVYMK